MRLVVEIINENCNINIRDEDGKIDPDLLVNNLVQLFSILVRLNMSVILGIVIVMFLNFSY